MAATAVLPWTKPGGGKLAAAVRSLMPWSALSAVPVAAGAAITGRRGLAAASGVVGAAAVAMAAPLVVPRRQPAADPNAAPLRVTHANLLYVNRRVAAVPRPSRRSTPTCSRSASSRRRTAAGSHATALSAAYPHQIELAMPHAGGAGLWSRWPMTAHEHTSTSHRTIVADVHAPGGPVRVITIHTVSPMHGYGEWSRRPRAPRRGHDDRARR